MRRCVLRELLLGTCMPNSEELCCSKKALTTSEKFESAQRGELGKGREPHAGSMER